MKESLVLLVLLTRPLFGQVIVRNDLAATDTYYSKSSKVLYVTTASTSSHAPNSILMVDPATGADIDTISAGDDPQLIAGADDGRYAYVWLRGAKMIRRFDLQAKKPDLEFPAAMTGAPQDAAPRRMTVAPGHPELLAISFVTSGGNTLGIALFNSGIPLPNTVPGTTGCQSMTFGTDSSSGWCPGGGLYKLAIDTNGVRVAAGPLPNLVFGSADVPPIFYGGRLYFNSSSAIVAPESGVIAGYFSVDLHGGDFAADPETAIIYFSRSLGYHGYIYAMDLNRFTPVAYGQFGWMDFGGQLDFSHGMVVCGSSSLAGIVDYNAAPLAILPLSAIKPLATPSIGPVTETADGVRRLAMITSQIAYDPNSDRLFANVPASVPEYGNSVFPIDLNTLSPGTPLWIGANPSVIRVTDSGRHLYQALGGNLIRRVDLSTFQPDLDIPLFAPPGHPIEVLDMVPLIDSDESIAVARNALFDSLAIYDRGQARPDVIGGGPSALARGISATSLYGIDGYSTIAAFLSYSVSSQGLALSKEPIKATPFGGGVFYTGLSCDHDICADSYGDVIDGASVRWLGRCQGTGLGTPLVDTTSNRVYYLGAASTGVQISSCDLATFLLAEQWGLATAPDFAGNLWLRGRDQFVLNTGAEIITVPRRALAPVSPTHWPQSTASGSNLTLKVVAKAGVYDATRDRLYVALTYDAVGTLGNSIGVVNPSTGGLDRTIQVGGAPSLLALSSDGAYLWVGLANVKSILRVNLSSGSIDRHRFLEVVPSAIAAVPGRPASIAVASSGYLGIYDDGIERPNAYRSLVFSASSLAFGGADTIFAGSGNWGMNEGAVSSFHVDGSGITLLIGIGPSMDCAGDRIAFAAGRIFGSAGCVLDPITLTLIDRLAGMVSVAPDPATGRLYAAGGDGVYSYDLASLTVLAKSAVSDAQHQPIIPCGTQRIAVLGTKGLTFVPVSGMAAVAHLPASVAADGDGISRMSPGVTDIAWDARSNRIIAALDHTAGPEGNSLYAFDPAKGSVSRIGPLGSDPGAVSMAPDLHVAYVGVSGPGLVSRVNLDSGAVENSWSLPAANWIPGQVGAIAAISDSVVVNLEGRTVSEWQRELIVFDGGKARARKVGVFPDMFLGVFYPADTYATELFTTPLQPNQPPAHWTIDTTGMVLAQPAASITVRSFKTAAVCGGAVYLSSGQVWDPRQNRITADYAVDAALVACDAVADHAYFLSMPSTDSPYFILSAYEISTGEGLGSLTFAALNGAAAEMIAAGPHNVAIRTAAGMLAVVPLSLLSLNQGAPPKIASVVNAGSGQAGIAPAGWISIFGTNLALRTRAWRDEEIKNGMLPTALDGVRVYVHGKLAALSYISPTQLNVQVPDDNFTGNAALQVVTPAGSAATYVAEQQAAPGLFVFPQENGKYVAAAHGDWSPVGKSGLYPNSRPANPSEVVVLYGTGFGPTNPATPAGQVITQPAPLASSATATIGAIKAEVQWGGVTAAGLWQFNVRIPPGLPDGDASVVVSVSGGHSQAGVFITIGTQ